MTTFEHLKVVVASPSDVQKERESLRKILEEINRHTARLFSLHLDILCYEDNAFPGFHKDGPQGWINEILQIEKCDIFICIFWKKFGTITKFGTTGTEDEFKQACKACKIFKSPILCFILIKQE